MVPRVGGRPNKDRERVTIWLERDTIAAVQAEATAAGATLADTYRAVLNRGLGDAIATSEPVPEPTPERPARVFGGGQ